MKTLNSRFFDEAEKFRKGINPRNKSVTMSRYSQRNFHYVEPLRKTDKTKVIKMDASMLKQRIKNESDVFKKYNHSLSKYFHIGSDGTTKGGFELF